MSEESQTKELLRALLIISDDIRAANLSGIKVKLTQYKRIKKLLKNLDAPSQKEILVKKRIVNAINVTSLIIEKQLELIKTIREKIILIMEKAVIGGSVIINNTNFQSSRETEEILREVIPLLNLLVNNLHSQKNTLINKNYSFVEKIENYKIYFHNELDIYQKYTIFAKQIISNKDLINNSKWNAIKEKGNAHFQKQTLKNIVLVFVLCLFFDSSTYDFLVVLSGMSSYEVAKVLYLSKQDFKSIALVAKNLKIA